MNSSSSTACFASACHRVSAFARASSMLPSPFGQRSSTPLSGLGKKAGPEQPSSRTGLYVSAF
jgi:hypothetical protein